jgi:hypothetical protein
MLATLNVGGSVQAEGYHGASNALTAWPANPVSPGGYWIGNSNGVVYILTSGLGSTWTSTNKLAP